MKDGVMFANINIVKGKNHMIISISLHGKSPKESGNREIYLNAIKAMYRKTIALIILIGNI
jgi:hypothetical protein